MPAKKEVNPFVVLKCRRLGRDSFTGEFSNPLVTHTFSPEAFEQNFAEHAIGLGWGYFEAVHMPNEKCKKTFEALSAKWDKVVELKTKKSKKA